MAINDGYHPLKQIVDAWLNKIHLAKDHKKSWQDVADQCQMFFSAATGFMWDPKFKHKFWGSKAPPAPTFKITIAKAFELVAIFGPTLYWRNPGRTAEPRRPIEMPGGLLARKMGVTPEMMQQAPQVMQAVQAGQQVPPQALMMAQQVQMFQQEAQKLQQSTVADTEDRELRADLMQRYLNWTPSQLRLHRHASLAITEALVKGRGVLWSEPYRPPGSQQVMIGSFFGTVDKFYIDPDCEDVDEAYWIVREREMPTWKAERKWNLPRGALKDAGNRESADRQGEVDSNGDRENQRAMGDTQDLITVYEIWSRTGLGSRLTDTSTELKEKLDRVCGDYCYLVVAHGVPYPLNYSSQKLQAGSNEDVQKAFRWPTPHWRDGRWPCSLLDFYPSPRSIWPIPPLGPGLGELIALNVFVAHLANRIWMSSRDFLVVMESAAEAIEKQISKGADLSFLRVKDGEGKLQDVVDFLRHPPTNMDAWKIVEALLEMFERRTGLSEVLAGVQKKQDRTATSANIRQQNVSIRPDDMASKVETWMTDVAQRERLAVRWWVTGEDVRQLLGDVGAALWQEYITDAPVERTVHDIDYRVEAHSARKPNRATQIANLHEALPVWLPVMQGREQQSGNWEPINRLMAKWGEAVEMETAYMASQPPPPQPDPAQQQAQAELEMKQAEMQMQQAGEQAKQQQDQQTHQQEMVQDQQVHRQELTQKQQLHLIEMETRQRRAALEAAIAKSKAAANRAAVKGPAQ